MDHGLGFSTLVLVLVFAPLAVFLVKCFQVSNTNPRDLVGAAPRSFRDPPILSVYQPFDVVRQLVMERLPRFQYFGGTGKY